jgi:hypothetical protein
LRPTPRLDGEQKELFPDAERDIGARFCRSSGSTNWIDYYYLLGIRPSPPLRAERDSTDAILAMSLWAGGRSVGWTLTIVERSADPEDFGAHPNSSRSN